MLDGIQAQLNSERAADRLYAAMIVIGSSFGFLAFAALPLISSFLFLSMCLGLGLTLDRWVDSEVIPLPEAVSPDRTAKLVLFGIIVALGIGFMFQTALLQVTLGTLGSFALSAFFASQCVINPQRKLNRALRQAVINRNHEHVQILLNRGADPFECDEQRNHCFHLAISNHDDAPALLQSLLAVRNRERVTFRSILTQFSGLWDNNVIAHCRALYRAIIPLARDRSQPNRVAFYNAFEQWILAFYEPLSQIVSRAFLYTQQNIENTQNLMQQNLAGQTPDSLINVMIPETAPDKRQALRTIIQEPPAQTPPSPSEPPSNPEITVLFSTKEPQPTSETQTPAPNKEEAGTRPTSAAA